MQEGEQGRLYIKCLQILQVSNQTVSSLGLKFPSMLRTFRTACEIFWFFIENSEKVSQQRSTELSGSEVYTADIMCDQLY